MGSASNHNESGFINPNLQASKKYPTFGYVTNPSMNMTVTVTPPISFAEQFKEFWSIHGQPISIIAGGFASLVFAKIRSTDKQSEDTKKR